MAGGWAPEGGVQDQIEDNIADAVHKARRCLPVGNGRAECEDCGNQIPAARRTALPGARTCVPASRSVTSARLIRRSIAAAAKTVSCDNPASSCPECPQTD